MGVGFGEILGVGRVPVDHYLPPIHDRPLVMGYIRDISDIQDQSIHKKSSSGVSMLLRAFGG